jgi:iron complex outermembrane recepter protein
MTNVMRGLRRSTCAVLAAALSAAMPVVAAAADLEDTHTFAIPSQSLSAALLIFSEQAKIQVMMASADLAAITSVAVAGERTAHQALDTLLQGTGLRFRKVSTDAVAIEPANARGSGGESSGTNASSDGRGEEMANAAGSARADHPQRLEEIVVSASKRGESSVQDVPSNVSAIGEDFFKTTGATDAYAFARKGNIQLADQGNNSNSFVIRGIRGVGASIVGVYIDEILGSGFGLNGNGAGQPDLRLFDINRVEILRGPQGTLYGAGSLGGTVRYITNKPDSTGFSSSFAADMGFVAQGGDQNYSVDGMLNLPIIADRFALRIVGSGEERTGLVTRLRTGEHNTDDVSTRGGRILASFTPTDNFSALASIFYQKREWDDSNAYVDACSNATNQCFGFTGQISSDGRRATNLPLPVPTEEEMLMYNLTATLDLSAGSIVSTTSYFDRDAEDAFDISDVTLNLASFLPFLPYAPDTLGIGRRPENNTVFSQELRFASRFDGPIQLVGGAFYSERKQDYQELTDYVDPTGTGPQVPHFVTQLSSQFTNKAVFGELTYSLSDKIDVIVGLRAFELTTAASDAVLVDDPGFYTLRRCPEGDFTLPPAGVPGLPACNQPLQPLPVVSGDARKERFDDVTYKLGLAYRATDDVLLYATVANGFREGGVNGSRTSNFVPLAYGPDTAVNYELGWKTTLLDHQLLFNGAVFRLDWEDTQVQVVPPFGVFGAIYNAGEQRFTGLELEATFSPNALDGLELTFGMTRLDAELLERTPSAAAPEGTLISGPNDGQPGDTPVLLSDLIASASAQYAFADARWNPYLRVDYSFNGGYKTAYNPNDPLYRKIDDYSLLAARFGVELEGWKLSLYVDNIADERGPVSIFARPSVAGSRAFSDLNVGLRPRTVGVNIRKDFQ